MSEVTVSIRLDPCVALYAKYTVPDIKLVFRDDCNFTLAWKSGVFIFNDGQTLISSLKYVIADTHVFSSLYIIV